MILPQIFFFRFLSFFLEFLFIPQWFVLLYISSSNFIRFFLLLLHFLNLPPNCFVSTLHQRVSTVIVGHHPGSHEAPPAPEHQPVSIHWAVGSTRRPFCRRSVTSNHLPPCRSDSLPPYQLVPLPSLARTPQLGRSGARRITQPDGGRHVRGRFSPQIK